MNPIEIEMAFSKLKRLIRSVGARTIDALWITCGRLLDHLTETDFRNYFRYCQYRYT